MQGVDIRRSRYFLFGSQVLKVFSFTFFQFHPRTASVKGPSWLDLAQRSSRIRGDHSHHVPTRSDASKLHPIRRMRSFASIRDRLGVFPVSIFRLLELVTEDVFRRR